MKIVKRWRQRANIDKTKMFFSERGRVQNNATFKYGAKMINIASRFN